MLLPPLHEYGTSLTPYLISEIAASDTCPRRNFFREMEISPSSSVKAPTASPLPPTPYPTQTKATKKGTCRWKERGRDEECSWQCPSRHCLEKSSLPGGDGTPAGSAPSGLWLAGTVLQRWRSLRPWEPGALYSLKPALAPPTGRLQPGESLGAGRACAPGPQGQAACTRIWDSTSSHPRQLHVLVCA